MIHQFLHERNLFQMFPQKKYLIALDEVGRGCLAGPVVTVASLWEILPSSSYHQNLWITLFKDSKKMTAKSREKAFSTLETVFPALKKDKKEIIQESLEKEISWNTCTESSQTRILYDSSSWPQDPPPLSLMLTHFGIGASSSQEIDEINIWQATQLAMNRSLNALKEFVSPKECFFIVDGHLPLKVEPFWKDTLQINSVGADDAFVTVGFSSVVAKVLRDTYMTLLHQDYPAYELASHKGYATKTHREAILKHGLQDIHRRSFCEKLISSKN